MKKHTHEWEFDFSLDYGFPVLVVCKKRRCKAKLSLSEVLDRLNETEKLKRLKKK